MSSPSIERIAHRLDVVFGDGSARQDRPGRQTPLCPRQRRIWNGHLAGDGTAYVVPCVFDLPAAIDLTRLLGAIGEVIAANPILRSAVVQDADDGWLMQDGGAVIEPQQLGWTDDPDEAVARWLRVPFGPAEPLTRVAVWRHGDGIARVGIVFHHVVMDGVSLSLFLQDIHAEYQVPGSAVLTRRPRYADLIRPGRPASERWCRSDIARGATLDSWDADRHGRLPETTVDRDEFGPGVLGVPEYARARSVAPVAVWTAAAAVALSRMLGGDTFTFTMPFANRRELEEFETIGPFVNTIPVTVEIRPDQSLRELVLGLDHLLTSAAAHSDADVGAVVDDLRAHGVPVHTALDIFLNFQEVDRSHLDLGGVGVTPVAVHSGEGKGGLTISIQSGRSRAECQVESALRDWNLDTHHGLRSAMDVVLGAIADDDGRRVGDLEVGLHGVPAAAQQPGTTIVERLRRQGATRPDELAVADGHRELTWTDLLDGIDRAAAALSARGIGRGERVLIDSDRTVDFVVWAAAAMSVGAAYVPVDPQQGPQRLAEIAARSDARTAVGRDDVFAGSPRRGLTVIATDSLSGLPGHVPAGLPEHSPAEQPDDPTRPDDTAYVIFTSGTTGTPKGVAVSHRNVLALIDATGHYLEPGDVVSCVHAFTFDFSVWEIWCALARGAQVRIFDRATTQDPFELAMGLGRAGVSVLSLTNTAFGALQTACTLSADAATAVGRSVRTVVLGGEAVTPGYVRSWLARFGGPSGDDCRVVNMLGATETTVHTTELVLTTGDTAGEVVPAGQALSHLDVVITDAAGHSLPSGVLGEIAVRGEGVADGYLGQGALTASRFVPDTFPAAAPGGRLYRTGDVGRWRWVDGAPSLEVCGRRDRQVKVRGRRIELSGVERVLNATAGVDRGVVVVDDACLRAFIACAGLTAPELVGHLGFVRGELRKRLAPYEVPDRIDVVSDFPRTATGKIDTDPRGLAALVITATSTIDETSPADREPSEPSDDFRAVLDSVLPGIAIDPDASFTANGGDSIRAVQLVGGLRERGHRLSVADVLSAASVAELQTVLAGADGPAAPAEDSPLGPFALVSMAVQDALPADVEDAYPLSAAQQGMLFHVHLDAEVGVYHNTMSLRLRGVLDPRAFRVALTDTMNQHETLRTAIDEVTDREPIQAVYRQVPAPFRFVDATAEPDGARALLDRLIEQERDSPFDLSVAPLFRITLVRVSATENQLIVSDSHLILDGWSWTSTLAEIIQRHNALVAKDAAYEASPERGVVRFADFIEAERRARRCPRAAAAWRDHLRGVTPRSIADLRPAAGRDVQRLAIDIDDGLAEALRTRAAADQISVRHLMMAVHYSVLARVFNSADVLSGVTSNGRLERAGGADTRGMFLNMLPYRVQVRDDLAALAGDCARLEAAMADHRRLPLVDIQHVAGRGTLFDFGFNYVQFHRLGQILESHEIGSTADPHFSREDTDLALMATFSVHPPAHRLALMLIADTARVSRTRLNRLAREYRELLVQAAAAGSGAAL